MSNTIRPALLAFALLSGALSISPQGATAAETCLAAPKGAAPQGSHWYYRLERPSLRKCWRLVQKDTKDQAARVTPQTDEAQIAAPPPSPPAERTAEAEAKTSEPAIRTLVTRNVSNIEEAGPRDRLAPTPDQTANAPAPVEQAANADPASAPVAAPAIAEPVPRAAMIAPAIPSKAAAAPAGTPILSWLLAGIALPALLACAVFLVIDMRRRRTDVLNTAGDADALPFESSSEMSPDDDATFAPLPALRASEHEDDVDRALRRFAQRRRAA